MKSWHCHLKIILFTVLLGQVALAQPIVPNESKGLKECASCHYQWIPAFDDPDAILLIEKPAEPMEARTEVCLGCHDGSVDESRRRVWQEHGHKTGIVPPPGMVVPEQLPLRDGKLACRTCHTAHIGDGPVDLENPFFLRVKNDKAQLCQLCHSDKVPSQGRFHTHPIGKMDHPVPAELIEAGAHATPDEWQVHCQVCHNPHGSKKDHLLVMGADNNNLCLTCHEEQRPGMWHEKPEGLHPDRPVIHNPVQIDAINSMGTRLGQDNRLLCLSCHKMHGGKSGKFMLAMSLEDSDFCLQCHPDQKGILTTVHDPRRFPVDYKNHQGLTVEEGGPCSTCHMFHNLAQEPQDPDLDPHNMCLACHSETGLVNKKNPGKGKLNHSHPMPALSSSEAQAIDLPLFVEKGGDGSEKRVTCQTCHNLHESDKANCLRTSSDELCQKCHTDMSHQMAGNAHDFHTMGEKSLSDESDMNCRICHKQIHSEQKVKNVGQCGLCHKMHSWQPDQGLWSFTNEDLGGTSNKSACEVCHDTIQWASSETEELVPGMVMHPHGSYEEGDYPGCQSCHDPHAKATMPALLRDTQTSPDELCYQCHDEQSCLSSSMHGELAFGEQADKKRPCSPCHSVHVHENSTRDKLWALPLNEGGSDASEKRCLSCHTNGGTAKSINMFEHPEPLLITGAIQVWQRSAHVELESAAKEKITCNTCHLPHGRCFDGVELKTGDSSVQLAHVRSLKPMLRPNVANEFCSQCHGPESLNYYLFYHDSSKRK